MSTSGANSALTHYVASGRFNTTAFEKAFSNNSDKVFEKSLTAPLRGQNKDQFDFI